jgi:hypothetical protein
MEITEKQFWDWFMENKEGLEIFITSDSKDYTLYNLFSDKLNKYQQNLLPELTINKDEKFVLILSCDGIKAGIPYVVNLFDSAPAIEDWVIQKFRQPGIIDELNYNGIAFSKNDIKIKHSVNGEKIDVKIYIKGYDKNDSRFKALAFLYLDHFIGEYNVMTKIGVIEFEKIGLFTKTSELISLQDLKNKIDTNIN